MSWLTVDNNKDKTEVIWENRPIRNGNVWSFGLFGFPLPKGSIKRLIGKEMTWEDAPIEFLGDEKNI